MILVLDVATSSDRIFFSRLSLLGRSESSYIPIHLIDGSRTRLPSLAILDCVPRLLVRMIVYQNLTGSDRA